MPTPLETSTTRDYVVRVRGAETKATLEWTGDLDNVSEAVVLAHGFRSLELAKERRALARLGVAAISFRQPNLRKLDLLGRVGEMRARFVSGVAEGARAFGVHAVTLAGHSLGGPDVAEAALRTDQDVVSVEYRAGAGFLSEDDFFKAAKRLSNNAYRELLADKALMGECIRDIAVNVVGSPLQSVAEGVYGSRTKMRERVEELTEQGVDQGYTHFADDLMFPPDIILQHPKGLPERKMLLTGKELLHACHGAPYHAPEGVALALKEMMRRRDEQPVGYN